MEKPIYLFSLKAKSTPATSSVKNPDNNGIEHTVSENKMTNNITPAPHTPVLSDIHTRPIAPPVYEKVKLTTEQAANLLIKGKIGDRHLDGTTNTLYEFFSVANSQGYPYHSPGEFNANQKDQARQALQSWSDVANVQFTELDYNPTYEEVQVLMGKHSHNDHRLIFGLAPYAPDHALHDPAYGGRHSSQAVFGFSTVDPDFGHESYKRSQLASVIGNALGLGGPLQISTKSYIDNTGKTVPGDTALHTMDTRDYTMMSPHAGKNSLMSTQVRKRTYGPDYEIKREENMPAAPLLHDVIAIQKMYGANMKTRNTDTTYGFNSNTGRDFLSLHTAKDKAIFCVWDGGGNDTLDFSGFSQNQKINLYERAFSDVGGMQSNVSIARGVTLENAIGGAGDDLLIGNHADNRLKGGIGADTLEGGNGADTFVYDKAEDSTPDKHDFITDFTSGTDKIDLSGLLKNSGIDGFNFVKDFTGKAGDAVLAYDQQSGQGRLAVDLTGNGQADFLIKTAGPIASGDVLFSPSRQSSQPKAAVAQTQACAPLRVAEPTPSNATRQLQFSPLNSAGKRQASADAPVVENKKIAYVTLEHDPSKRSVHSQIPETSAPITIVSVGRGSNWNYYIDMPKHANDNDLVVINTTSSNASKIVFHSTNGKEYQDLMPGQKRSLRYSADTKTWSIQKNGDDSQWVGSKILLGTSHALVKLDRGNWRPEARLPTEATDGDVLRLHSDAPLPIDVKAPGVDSPTLWRMTRGDFIDFKYSAQSDTWEMMRPPEQFYRPQPLADGVLPPPKYGRTYLEVANDNWKESITLPTKGVVEGCQVVVKTTADAPFKIKTGQASYTIGPGDTVTFSADKQGNWIRQLESGDTSDYASYRSKQHYLNQDGVWRANTYYHVTHAVSHYG
ncbi:M10 family metallopeptidase C-terminal domain-containing protein [Pseudomonas palleroniana]